MATKSGRVTATGDVVAQGRRCYVKSAVLTGAVACLADLRSGGAGGAIKQSLNLGAAGTEPWTSPDDNGMAFPDGIHATLSAAGSLVVEYDDVPA